MANQKKKRTLERGSTLVEVVMYLSILLTMLFLFVPIIQVFFKPWPIYTQIRLEREAALFFRQTAEEVNRAHSYLIEDSGKLTIFIGSEQFTYDQHGQKIIRKKSDQPLGGHIEMAHFVKEINFYPVDKQIFRIALKLEKNDIEYEFERWMGLKINYSPPEGLVEGTGQFSGEIGRDDVQS